MEKETAEWELKKPQKKKWCSFVAEQEQAWGGRGWSGGRPILKQRGWGSATGEREEKGAKADEMERKIQKEDLVVEGGRRECGKGSGNWEEWKAKSFEDCISCTVWKGYGSFSDIDVLDWG